MALSGQKTLAVVTGASRGIGEEIALHLAECIGPNSAMILSARNSEKLNNVRQQVCKRNTQLTVTCIEQDLANEFNGTTFESKLRELIKSHGRFDTAIIVHNAGSIGNVNKPAVDLTSASEWHSYLQVNLISMIQLNCVFLNVVSANVAKRRCVINISSLLAVQQMPSFAEYCVGKSAREAYLNVLAAEQDSLRILNYAPGPIQTDMFESIVNNAHEQKTRSAFQVSILLVQSVEPKMQRIDIDGDKITVKKETKIPPPKNTINIKVIATKNNLYAIKDKDTEMYNGEKWEMLPSQLTYSVSEGGVGYLADANMIFVCNYAVCEFLDANDINAKWEQRKRQENDKNKKPIAVVDKNTIRLIGGTDEQSNPITNHIIYDYDNKKEEAGTNMTTPRFDHAAALLGSDLVVCGGAIKKEQMTHTSECERITESKSIQFPFLPVQLAYHHMFNIGNNRLLIVGGIIYPGPKVNTKLYMFDEKTSEKWTPRNEKIESKGSGDKMPLYAVVLPGSFGEEGQTSGVSPIVIVIIVLLVIVLLIAIGVAVWWIYNQYCKRGVYVVNKSVRD